MAKSCILLIAFFGLNALLCDAGGRDIRVAVAQTYYAEIGTKEATGRNDGVRVNMYQHSVKQPSGTSWCAAFVSWCLQQHGVRNPKNAWSPAWFPRSATIWKQGTGTAPAAGDVFGIWYTNLNRVGHVGFVDHWGSKYASTVEGNTNGAGAREGNGVWKKRRLIKQIYAVSRWIHD